MGLLQRKNALTKRCVTVSSELVQYFANWVDKFSYWKIQTNKCRYKHTNHSVMPYDAQGIDITRSLNTAGCPSGTCGGQSGDRAGWKCQCVHFYEEITESEASGRCSFWNNSDNMAAHLITVHTQSGRKWHNRRNVSWWLLWQEIAAVIR
jgi:hypothetical protein